MQPAAQPAQPADPVQQITHRPHNNVRLDTANARMLLAAANADPVAVFERAHPNMPNNIQAVRQADPARYEARLSEAPSIWNIRNSSRRDIEVCMAPYIKVIHVGETSNSFIRLRTPDFVAETDPDDVMMFRFVKEIDEVVWLPASLVDELQEIFQARHNETDSELLSDVAESCKNYCQTINLHSGLIGDANNFAPIIAYNNWLKIHRQTNAITEQTHILRWKRSAWARADLALRFLTPMLVTLMYVVVTNALQDVVSFEYRVLGPDLTHFIQLCMTYIFMPIFTELLRRTLVTNRGISYNPSARLYTTIFRVLLILIRFNDGDLRIKILFEFFCAVAPLPVAVLFRLIYTAC
jgi:hypothetical protein